MTADQNGHDAPDDDGAGDRGGRRESVVDFIVNETRRGIAEGRLALGQRLVETDLIRDLGVSRGALREALRHLSADGVVDLIPYRGAVVRRLRRKDVSDRYALRIALESLAAAQAAGRTLAAEQREALLAAEARCAELLPGQNRPQRDANYALHRLIADLSDNGQIAQTVERLWLPIQMVMGMQDVLQHDYWRVSNQQHATIVQAILRGKPAAAAAAMRRHLDSGCARILSLPSYVFDDR